VFLFHEVFEYKNCIKKSSFAWAREERIVKKQTQDELYGEGQVHKQVFNLPSDDWRRRSRKSFARRYCAFLIVRLGFEVPSKH
jgi:hypothetical protein